MAKSTVDDLLACYRLAGKLGRSHKVKLISLLTEDVSGQGLAHTKPERKKKPLTKEEETRT